MFEESQTIFFDKKLLITLKRKKAIASTQLTDLPHLWVNINKNAAITIETFPEKKIS